MKTAEKPRRCSDVLLRASLGSARLLPSRKPYEKRLRRSVALPVVQRIDATGRTTATTIGGLLPLALGGGPLWEGLAWCMIFGLLVATLLTLLVVPAIYAIMVETFRVSPLPPDSVG